jgi:hypothetical protein
MESVKNVYYIKMDETLRTLKPDKYLQKHFVVLGHRRRESRRFRLLDVRTRLRFFDLDPELFDELTEFIKKDSIPGDLIGVRFRCEGYNKDGFIPFKPADEFNARDVISMIELISQSNSDCDITSELFLDFCIKYGPLKNKCKEKELNLE